MFRAPGDVLQKRQHVLATFGAAETDDEDRIVGGRCRGGGGEGDRLTAQVRSHLMLDRLWMIFARLSHSMLEPERE